MVGKRTLRRGKNGGITLEKNKTFSICISVINAIGVICLIYFAILYLSHSTYIVNPNAMLPMENWERAGMMLTIGVIPMFIANILGFLYILKEKNIFMRLLFFIPSLLEIGFVVHYWILV